MMGSVGFRISGHDGSTNNSLLEGDVVGVSS